MGRRISLLLTWLSVALILAVSPLASFAEPASPIYTAPNGLNPPPGFDQSAAQVAVLVELADPPATSGAGDAPAVQSQRIAAAQAALLRDLSAMGARVLYQVRLAANGIAVTVPPDKIDSLRRLPGVVRLSLIPPKLPAETGVVANGSPAVEAAVTEATGRGVRVGVIDRGVDYTHADFGGPGTPAAYAANNPAVVEPGTFPTAKVVGGYDLAGDGYDASGGGGGTVPAPDPDPLECYRDATGAIEPKAGRGTHMAGLAAGFGVAADGTTYRGPYGSGVDYNTFRVAPGAAPEAQLYALKIFGCSGTTALLTAAIERAIDPNGDGDPSDHLDVVVIAARALFGSPDDPDARAVDSAVRAGVVVVVAAGDTLNTFYSIASPASARLAIAVGASDGTGGILESTARGPLRGNDILKPDIVAPGVNVRSAAIGTGSAAVPMSGTTPAAPQVAGAAALLRQLHPDWSPFQIKTALMNAATPLQAPPSLAGAGQVSLSALSLSGLLVSGGHDVGLTFGAPWIAASTTATRTLLLENAGENDQIVSLSATAVATETGVTLTVPPGPIVVPAHGWARATVELAIDANGLDFTRDPATDERQGGFSRHYLAEHGGYIKVSSAGTSGTRVRPGHAAHLESVDIYLDDVLLDDSLDSREVQEYIATTPGPHTVILRREHSSPSSPVIFSAPVNLLDGKDYTLLVIGRRGALAILVVDETVPAPPPAGQGVIHFVNANRVEPNWNIGPLDVYLDGVLKVPALPVGATSPFFPIAPGQHEVAFYKAGVDPAVKRYEARKTFVVAAGEAVLAGTGRHDDDDDDQDEDGDDEQRAFIGKAPVRAGSMLLASVPYNVFPIVAARAQVEGVATIAPSGRAFSVGLRNPGARNAGLLTTGATPRTPIASAFELAARSPAITGLEPRLSAADVQYLGVTTNYSATQNLATTLVYFGLSTYAPWSTPSEVQFRVYIDSNRDGVDDFVLVNTNFGTALGGAPIDVFISGLYPIRPDGTLAPARRFANLGSFSPPSASPFVNVAPFNTSVMFQLLALENLALPLDPSNPNGPKGPIPSSFCYHVETRARDLAGFGATLDRVPGLSAPPVAGCGNRGGVLLYDVPNYAIAPINTTNAVFAPRTFERPVFLDVDGGRITGGYNPAVAAARGGAELLVLHHHNAPYPRAEVVPVGGRPSASAQPGTAAYVPVAQR